MKRHIAAGSLAVGLAGACLVVRSAVVATMVWGQEFPVIPGLFSLRYVRNPGAAFSLLAAAPEGFRVPFLIAVAALALVVLTYMYLWEGHKSRRLRVGLAMVAGGAAANLYERLLAGDVVDYLDLYVGSYHWPTFNLADTAISVGAGLLLLETLWGPRASRQASDGRRRVQQ